MKLFITGICGFVGSSLATWFREHRPAFKISGIDNFARPGSEINRSILRTRGVTAQHGDVRNASDFENLPAVDWVIDAAANPSVLAAIDNRTSSRQVIEHNLYGTVNLLEYCRRTKAGLILLSSSRVYSIPALAALPLIKGKHAFEWDKTAAPVEGASENGLTTEFSTSPPISLYGSTKLASESLALEYKHSFSFPVWIDRCGVIAGAGQFGTAEQGIFSYWIIDKLRPILTGDRSVTSLRFLTKLPTTRNAIRIGWTSLPRSDHAQTQNAPTPQPKPTTNGR